eukprot:TRINITY_DN508_c1_g2_i2.p1 TRINITY_DN508_c1_g2~~TRINITY_DN508_c1_g2_i2.p1  ORF type:complete len:204 (+),score=62.07 TRINITY_DN508_c1_g2_i2:111-722(+)
MASKQQAVIGQQAPSFRTEALMADGTFKEVKLSDYSGKYLVLFFYPLDFTFVCPTEITAFSDAADKFKEIGCELLACSVDSKFSHLAWTKTDRKKGGLGEMKIPILADITKEIASDYGCLIRSGDAQGIALRALYVIDKTQKLRQITMNDLPVGRSVDETLRLVQAFQWADEHDDVVPCNWTPGSKTMKPDPKGSLEFFEAEN